MTCQPDSSPSRPFPTLWIFIGMGILGLLDQLTKLWVSSLVPQGYSLWSLMGGGFQIRHDINPGLAWSLGGELPSLLRVALFAFLPILICVLLVWGGILKHKTTVVRTGSALVATGLASNLLDRVLRQGGVVDIFSIDLGTGLLLPTFNIADIILILGTAQLLVYGFAKLLSKGGDD